MDDYQTGADEARSTADAGADSGQPPRATAGREMLIQLQQMIDTLATQAGPVMREVAAKAAELAAVAGEKAGPIAHKAAGVTEQVGQRVAARSKVMAADLRASAPSQAETSVAADEPTAAESATDETRDAETEAFGE